MSQTTPKAQEPLTHERFAEKAAEIEAEFEAELLALGVDLSKPTIELSIKARLKHLSRRDLNALNEGLRKRFAARWGCEADADILKNPDYAGSDRDLARVGEDGWTLHGLHEDVRLRSKAPADALPGDLWRYRRLPEGRGYLTERVSRGKRCIACLCAGRVGKKLWCFRSEQNANLVALVPAGGLPEGVRPGRGMAADIDFGAPARARPEGFDFSAKFFEGRLVKILNAGRAVPREVRDAAQKFGLPLSFSSEALDEAERIPGRIDGRSLVHREDLRALPFVTIDGEDAKDFDDAVYCEETPGGWRLWVAIADVSWYVRPGSLLDNEALRRGTSVYFPNYVVPMLPEKLSNGLCSLNPGEDRLVMACEALVNREGACTGSRFFQGVIRSHARLTYTSVWSALEGKPEGVSAVGERLGELRRLYALYRALRAARGRRGALDFEMPEVKAVLGAEGEIEGFRYADRNDAHRIIEECMLVANVAAADFVREARAETLYRVHEPPAADRLSSLKRDLRVRYDYALEGEDIEALTRAVDALKDREGAQQAILRAMSRACYQPVNLGHFGLQYAAYAHFTSPIRRYPDLLLHRTIKGILTRRRYVPRLPSEAGSTGEEKKAPKPRDAWTRLGVLTSESERRADQASWFALDCLKAAFLEGAGRRGEYEATITGMIPSGVFVTLGKWPIDGYVHVSNLNMGEFFVCNEAGGSFEGRFGTVFRLGQRVRVQLEDADTREGRVSFRICPAREDRLRVERHMPGDDDRLRANR